MAAWTLPSLHRKQNADRFSRFATFCRFIRRCAVPFLRSDCLGPMLRVAVTGLSLDHREAHESLCLFLLHFVRAARDNTVSTVNPVFHRLGN